MSTVKTKKERKIPLTKKQAKFIKEYPRSTSGAAAAMKVYNVKDKKAAASMANQVLSKPHIRELINEELARQGLTPDTIVGAIKEGFKATKTISHKEELVDVPDFNSRHKYVDTTLRLMGALDRQDVPALTVQFGNIFNQTKNKYED